MTTDPKNPAPIADSEAPPQHPEDDHKVAENPPANEQDEDNDE
ncbi:MAG: hypothetical protein Q4G50_03400 [Corynebacterium sp.]|nr:hypothetical protein [Corynebacterium sp.]MDO5669029.1 hypothetical protein [Corynebacterium sp.]